MAEFVDVLRQFDRMCKANVGCFNCPLHEPDGVSDRCSIGAFINDSERIEREVMSWAAEHPEPVYPTWEKYLVDLMTLDMMCDKTDNPNSVENYMCKTPIPAEIAKKLGIEPKEG